MAEIEALGFGTLWVGGSPSLAQVRPFLERSSTITVATGILNVWQHEPAEVAAQRARLAGDFAGRFLLGIGVGHPEATAEYESPLAKMGAFFDGLDAAPEPVARDERVAAALGPRMLALAAARSLGTHTYFVTPEHTRFAREQVGPDALVAPELAVVVEPDEETARAAAREYAALYLGRRNYTSNLLRFGFTERDVADGGSDRLIDAVIPHGSAERVAEAVRAHLDAGADHVALQPLGHGPAADRRLPGARESPALAAPAPPAGGACPTRHKPDLPDGEATSAPPTLGPWPPSTRPSTAPRLRDLIERERGKLLARTEGSQRYYERALAVMPRGVPSSFQAADPRPIYLSHGEGSHVWDVDGNEYVDFHNGFGVMCVGHGNPAIVAAVSERAARGSHFAAPTEGSIVVAEELARRFGLPQWRFTNSGTESTMDAIHLARAATGRDLVLKIEGSYHGHHDAVMVSVRPPLDQLGERGVAGQRPLRRRPPARGQRADEGDPVQRRSRCSSACSTTSATRSPRSSSSRR